MFCFKIDNDFVGVLEKRSLTGNNGESYGSEGYSDDWK